VSATLTGVPVIVSSTRAQTFQPRRGISFSVVTSATVTDGPGAGIAPRREWYAWLLLTAYGVFTCGYFIFADYSDHYRFFARFLFFLALFAIAAPLRQLRQDRLFLLTLAYAGYLLLSGFWSSPFEWYRLGQKTTITIYLIVFFALTAHLTHWRPDAFRKMLMLATGAAAVNATATVIAFYSTHPFPGTRLEGIGSLTNINEFANVNAVFALLAAGFATSTPSKLARAAFWVAIALFVCFAWLGQSRTAFAALLTTLLAFVLLTYKRRAVLPAAALLAGTVLLVIAFPESLQLAVERGSGLRPAIWQGFWLQAQAAPIFGLGLISDLHVVVQGLRMEGTHNAYLQVLLHGGVVGLALFLALFISAALRAKRIADIDGDYTVLCIFLYCALAMLTGVDILIDRPRDQWMLFWFPLALALAGRRRLTK
jgi:O-antigen ligase